MGLHRLTAITMGVPNVDETCAYYAQGMTWPAPSASCDGGTSR